MPGNLNVATTVNSTQLRSGLALAQQDIKTFGAAVRAAAADIKTSASATAEQVVALDKASAAYNKAKGEAAGFQQKLEAQAQASRGATGATNEMSTAHGHMAGSAGVAREALVMLHETMMGNYKRLAGSTMVMAERTNALHAVMTALTPAMMGAVGAAAALAAGFAYLVVQSMHAETALRGVYNAALLQGRGAAQAEADTKTFAAAMVQTGTVGRKNATEIASAIQSIPGVAEDVRAKLSAIAPALFEVWGQDAEKTTKNIDTAFRSISSLGAFLDENRLLTSEQGRAFKAAEATKDAYAAQRIGVDALTARLGPAYEGYKKMVDEQKIATSSAALGAFDPTGKMIPQMKMEPLRMPESGSHAEDESTRRQTEAAERYLGVMRERTQLESDAKQIQSALSTATTDGQRAELSEALKVNAARQAGLKDQGDASWAAKVATDAKEAGDAAVIAAHNAGAKRIEIMEAGTKAEMEVYRAASRDMTRTDAERLNAKRQALTLEMSLIEKTAGGEATAAKQALEAKLATLSAEQAAQHGNFANVMALEDQKLALLKQAGAAYTKQFQEELKTQENMQRQHTGELQRIELEHLTKTAEIDREDLATKKSNLAAEVSDHLITKQTEIAQLQVYADQQYQIKHAALQNFIDNNAMELAERTKALDQMANLEAQHAKETAALKAQMAAADRATAQASEREWTSAFSSIGQSGERAMTGLIMETTTYRKAEMQVASSVIESAISMGSKVVESWAATELAKKFLTDSGVKQRVEAEQAGGTTGLSVILARWVGLEEAKSTETTVGAAHRAATDSGGGFLSSIGSMVAGWFGMETTKTAATTAGSAARTSVQTAADAAALTAALTANVAVAMSYAAVGAAAAGSSVAAIPLVGWAMAPGVAAETYGTLSGFAAMASLDVGTTNVPADMVAQIHQGEMVVPAFESSMIRSGQASLGGGGSDGGGGGDTHVHFNVSAMDGASVQSFFRSNASSIAQIVQAQQSRNPSMRASY